jgi:putative transposase
VEIWFNLVAQRAIHHGTFRSVKELVSKIEQFVQRYNNLKTQSFIWTAKAGSILQKIKRLCERISKTQH